MSKTEYLTFLVIIVGIITLILSLIGIVILLMIHRGSVD